MSDHEFRDEVTSYIEGRTWKQIDIEELAQQLNMSLGTFIGEFHRIYGTTPAVYIVTELAKRVRL